MNNDPKDEKDSAPADQENAAEQANAAPEEQEQAAPVPAQSPAAGAKLGLEDIEGPEDVIALLKANATPILVGVLIAALAFAGVSFYKNNKKAQSITAQSMLFNSQSASQFSEIITKYAGTPTAPLAELSLGSQQFEDGQYDAARNTFATFAKNHPDHSLVAAAVFGQTACDEAQLKLGDALKGYDSFMKTQTDSFLFAQAVFGKGRCLEQMGRFDEARATYEDYIAGHPKDPWTARAETALMYVGKAKRASEQKAKQPPMTIQVPPAAAPVAAPAAAPAAPASVPAPAAK